MITAYRTAAKDALEVAQIIEKEEEIQFSVQFPYEKLYLVMDLLKKANVEILEQNLDSECSLLLRIELSSAKIIQAQLENLLK